MPPAPGAHSLNQRAARPSVRLRGAGRGVAPGRAIPCRADMRAMVSCARVSSHPGLFRVLQSRTGFNFVKSLPGIALKASPDRGRAAGSPAVGRDRPCGAACRPTGERSYLVASIRHNRTRRFGGARVGRLHGRRTVCGAGGAGWPRRGWPDRPRPRWSPGFCERLAAAGVDLARATVLVDTLHPIYEGRAFRWRRGGEIAPSSNTDERQRRGGRELAAQPLLSPVQLGRVAACAGASRPGPGRLSPSSPSSRRRA